MQENNNLTTGEKIVALRKSRNMTQAELGGGLNVSYQAVSKWERNESFPDFDTMSKIAQLFKVPLGYFSNESSMTVADALAAGSAVAPVAAIRADAKMLGVCKDCGRTVYEGEQGKSTKKIVKRVYKVGPGQSEKEEIDDASVNDLLCKACAEKRAVALKQREKIIQDAADREHLRVMKRKNMGLVFGSVAAAILLVLGIVGIVKNTEKTGVWIGITILLMIVGFAFVSQLFWNGAVVDCCLTGGKIIGTPGIIFEFDLDGFILLIVMKILFAIIRFIVFLATFLFFVIIAMIISPFTFIPALKRVIRGDLD